MTFFKMDGDVGVDFYLPLLEVGVILTLNRRTAGVLVSTADDASGAPRQKVAGFTICLDAPHYRPMDTWVNYQKELPMVNTNGKYQRESGE